MEKDPTELPCFLGRRASSCFGISPAGRGSPLPLASLYSPVVKGGIKRRSGQSHKIRRSQAAIRLRPGLPGSYESLSRANTSLAQIREFHAQTTDALVNLKENHNAQIDIIEAKTVNALEQAKAKCEAKFKRALAKLEAEANNEKVDLDSEIQVKTIKLQTEFKKT